MDAMQRVTSIIALLEGMQVVVAGGAARDLALGTVPRDYDLWVVQDIDVIGGLDCIQSALKYHRLLLDEYVEVSEVMAESYGGDPEEDDVEWVIKVTVGDTELDFIKGIRPSGEDVTPVQIVETFDYPCNQFWIAREGVIGIGHMRYDQYPLRGLCADRIKRMKDKFPTLRFHQHPENYFE